MQTLWSYTHPTPWRGLTQSRERGLTLAWDVRHGLHLFNHRGEPQAHWSCPGELIAAAGSDDGTSFAAVGSQGEVWLLAPDLSVRWERRVATAAVTVALEPFGRCLAVADASGTLYLLDHASRTIWQALNPRPLHHLAFVPEQPRLVVSADFGLVAAYDTAGRCVWRDGLVAHVGSLAVSGDGSLLVLACYSEGLCCYRNSDPKTRHFLPNTAPAHGATLSYDGKVLLTTDRQGSVAWRDAEGNRCHDMPCDAKPVALALDALGNRAVVALADGRLSAVAPPKA